MSNKPNIEPKVSGIGVPDNLKNSTHRVNHAEINAIVDFFETKVDNSELGGAISSHPQVTNKALSTHSHTASQITDLASAISSNLTVQAKLDILSIVDNLTSTAINLPGSANQLRILKGLIDAINALLLSDTTTLDSVQEIVDYIEINRSTLELLSIASIAGLSNALAGKADINHGHTGDVVGSEALTIVPNAVTNPKLAQVPTNTFKGRVAAGLGAVQDLTIAELQSALGVLTLIFEEFDFENVAGKINTKGKDGELYTWQKLGCTIKAKPIGMNLAGIGDELALVNGRIYLVPVFLNRTTTIASLGFIVNTEGVFTADNENRLAVYEDQAGVLTRVGITPNSDSIFTSTGAKTVNLTSSISLMGDKIYWIAILYNNSAQTVAPQIGGDAYSLPFSFRDSFLPVNTSASRFIAGATMPATITLSATTRSIEIPALFLI